MSQDPVRYAAGICLYAYVADSLTQVDYFGLHIASAIFTDSSGNVTDLGTFESDKASRIHSEPQILDALGSNQGGNLEITSLGANGDGSGGFATGRTKSGKPYSFPTGQLQPCTARSQNCDALLHNFATNNGTEITYKWNDNVRVYKPDGSVIQNGIDISYKYLKFRTHYLEGLNDNK